VGKFAAANRSSAPAADFSNPPTAGTPGARSPRASPQPTTVLSRIGIAAAQSQPNRIYATLEAKKNGAGVYVPMTAANPGNW